MIDRHVALKRELVKQGALVDPPLTHHVTILGPSTTRVNQVGGCSATMPAGGELHSPGMLTAGSARALRVPRSTRKKITEATREAVMKTNIAAA
jgi:hypothetical protein